MGRALTLLAAVAVLTGALSHVRQEPAGYIVAKVTIDDEDTYGRYRAGFGAILRQYAAHFFVRKAYLLARAVASPRTTARTLGSTIGSWSIGKDLPGS